jgi:dTDP-4-dehydrorhamnose reductase
MILLLGATGYVGQAFSAELRRREWAFIPLTRKAIDYTRLDVLFDYVRKVRPAFIINAAGYAPHPDFDACELEREDVWCANVLLPQTISRVCLMTNTPWGHVSSGSIYVGAKVSDRGRMRIERNLNQPAMQRLFAGHSENIHGFTEWDEPNFSFRDAPCNFYSGTKALAEEALRGAGRNYIWRPRMMFNECDDPRNLLAKLQHYDRVADDMNSISHLDEFVQTCLELWERQAPFGIYNVVNPGAITTRRIVEMIQRILKPVRIFEFWKNDRELYRGQTNLPRSNCILDISKLRSLGVKMRPVEEALEDALERWQTASRPMEFVGAGRH